MYKQNHKNNKTAQEKPRKKRFFIKLLKFCVIWGLLAFIILTIYIAILASKLPDPEKLSDRQLGQTTKIYDKTGEILLFDIFADKKRTLIELEDIPDYAINATLAVEDKNFYTHKGIAFKSILRATISNILGRKSGKGGASTLTQQLIKNAIIGDEHSLTRKLKEAILAMQLEKKYSKQDILKLYFNEIPYGSTNYGIEAASQSYFGKTSKNLTLGESATLAALPQAPSRYLNNQEILNERKNFILDLMVEQNHISKLEADIAKEENNEIKQQIDNSIKAPHFVMMVKQELSEKLGEKQVETGGLKITTTLDMNLQTIAEEEVASGAKYNKENLNAENAALVAIDVKSGEIRAMVGSRNFFDKEYDGQFNVAINPRQPGSSFKPLVYVAGFEKGYTPDTILYDVETVFPSADEKNYEPKNYDLKEHGPVSIRKALQGSLNIPAVKMIYLVGVSNILDIAEQIGYTTFDDRSRFGLSLVLGGGEVTLLEHTNAYATFARNGQYKPAISVLKVEDADGTILFENEEQKPKQIIDKNAVLHLTNILSDNNARAFVFGANSYLQLGERPSAAKTGTTNDYRDSWQIGYTPSLATGVWVGNNDNSEMKKGASGAVASGPIWQKFMQRALNNTPIEKFENPLPITETKPVLAGQDPGLQEVEIDKISNKLATEFTPEETRINKKFFAGHSILHHVDKNNPTGPAPTNPEQDPQYKAWEDAILKWAQKTDKEQGKIPLEISEPPTEYDDIHKPELKPIINIITPTQGASVDRTIIASSNASSPRGIARVRYFIDGIQVGESRQSPNFETELSLKQFEKGYHTFEARAYDDIWNTNKQSFDINLTGEPDLPTIIWNYPPPNVLFNEYDFPIDIEYRPTMPSRINSLSMYMQTPGDSFEQEIASSTTNISPKMSYKWKETSLKSGLYKFSIKLNYDENQTLTSQILPVYINK